MVRQVTSAGAASGLTGPVASAPVTSSPVVLSPVVAGTFTAAAAECIQGVGTPAALFLSGPNGAALGCMDENSSTAGYFAFQPATVAPEYVFGLAALPSPWKAADVTLSFYSSATTGSVSWSVETACGSGGFSNSPIYGPTATVTTAAAATANQIVNTATLANIATSASNGCVPGSTMQFRITRSAVDSLAAEAYLVGVSMTLRAS